MGIGWGVCRGVLILSRQRHRATRARRVVSTSARLHTCTSTLHTAARAEVLLARASSRKKRPFPAAPRLDEHLRRGGRTLAATRADGCEKHEEQAGGA
eukprot:scaffold26724_cov120-Isochrysis_galbana.AAC.1